MQNQIVQGRAIRNPYSNMQDEVTYEHADIESKDKAYSDRTPATYEFSEQKVPVGRPVSQPSYSMPQQVYVQPMMMAPQPAVPTYANNRDFPTVINCPNCHERVTTTVNKTPGKTTFAWAIILGMACGLCCVPFCIDSCMDKIHYCPRCGAETGKKHARFI